MQHPLSRPLVRVLLASAALSMPAVAQVTSDQGAEQKKLEKRVGELEQSNAELLRRFDLLAAEQEEERHGGLIPPVGESYSGFGPAASKVYAVEEGLSIGGYGEILYSDPAGGGDEFDALRHVTYFGYKFDEHWLFNSEIELEHASTSEAGSASVEFAYIDWLHSEPLNGRAGLVLVPMGFLNELHEPTTFLSANRPLTEQRIIPSTWRENGLGLHGDLGPVDYRAYVVNGLDATGFSASGLRGGRQKGSEALAEDLALVVRGDYTGTPGWIAGGSFYCGDSGQSQAGVPDAATTIWEGHVEYRAGGLLARGLVALAEVEDVAALNGSFDPPLIGAASIGEELEGYYAEVGYDVMPHLAPDSQAALIPFARWEHVDTQSEVPAGFSANPATELEGLTFGVHFRPIDRIVFKLDYIDFDGGTDQWNASLGYVF